MCIYLLVQTICRQYREAVQQVPIAEIHLEDIEEGLPKKELETWRQQIEEAEENRLQDLDALKIYLPDLDNGLVFFLILNRSSNPDFRTRII